jgi:hypothetical protein
MILLIRCKSSLVFGLPPVLRRCASYVARADVHSFLQTMVPASMLIEFVVRVNTGIADWNESCEHGMTEAGFFHGNHS